MYWGNIIYFESAQSFSCFFVQICYEIHGTILIAIIMFVTFVTSFGMRNGIKCLTSSVEISLLC